jgi:hypothetical protein
MRDGWQQVQQMEEPMFDFFLSARARLLEEGGLKALFDHLRNLLMATLIMAAGSYAIRRGVVVDLFGVLYDELAGFIVLAIGALLAILNALSGLHQLNKQQLHIGIRILAIGLYAVATVRLIQLVVVLRTG